MILLVLGLALWVAAHGIKIHAPAMRARLAAQYGEGAVKVAAMLAIVGSVVLMYYGYTGASYVELWGRQGWTIHLNNLLMVIALGIYSAGAFKGHVRSWIRHPQLIGTKTWAVAHLLPNGDLASVILFGGLLAWAVAATIGINKRDGKGPKPAPQGILWDGAHLLVTLALVAGIGWVHNWLGVWPFPGSPPA